MIARIAIALVATLIAAAMAVQLHAHNLIDSSVAQIRPEVAGDKDRAAHRAALEDALDVTDLRPGTGAFFTAIGLEVRAKRSEAAERLALRATEREPRNFSTWLTLGVLRRNRGDDVGAASAFARVRKLNPLYPTPR